MATYISRFPPRLFRRQTRLIQTITKTKEKVITEQQDLPDELATTGSQETQLTEKKEKITENIKVVEAEYFNNKNRALDPEDLYDTPRWRIEYDKLQDRAKLESWLNYKRHLKFLTRRHKVLEITKKFMPWDLTPQETPQDRNLGLPSDRTWLLSKNCYFFPPNYKDPRDSRQEAQYVKFAMLCLFPLLTLFIWKQKYIFEYLLDRWTFGRAPETPIDFESLPPPSTMYDPQLIVEDPVPHDARPGQVILE